jgi:predicted TIM-barrel fold metal-dependent hydrolase
MTKPARRIDVHFHFVPPVYREAVHAASSLGIAIRVPDWSPELALALMDRNGIHAALLSISVPSTHFGDDAKARLLSRQCNDYAAELIAKRPDRFGAFAAVALPDVDGAVEEIVRALDVLKLDGVGLLTSYGRDHLGHPRFDPILAALNERDAAVFIHPTAHPACRELTMDIPAFLVEYPFDTTRAAINLVLSGAMDRFPRIRFILPHAGGTLPFLSWRIAEVTSTLLTEPALMKRYPLPFVAEHRTSLTPDLIMSRLRRFWLDTASAAGSQVLACLEAVTEPDRILFGTDWPYIAETQVANTVQSLDQSVDDESLLRAINHDNAIRLFPRFGEMGQRRSRFPTLSS